MSSRLKPGSPERSKASGGGGRGVCKPLIASSCPFSPLQQSRSACLAQITAARPCRRGRVCARVVLPRVFDSRSTNAQAFLQRSLASSSLGAESNRIELRPRATCRLSPCAGTTVATRHCEKQSLISQLGLKTRIKLQSRPTQHSDFHSLRLGMHWPFLRNLLWSRSAKPA